MTTYCAPSPPHLIIRFHLIFLPAYSYLVWASCRGTRDDAGSSLIVGQGRGHCHCYWPCHRDIVVLRSVATVAGTLAVSRATRDCLLPAVPQADSLLPAVPQADCLLPAVLPQAGCLLSSFQCSGGHATSRLSTLEYQSRISEQLTGGLYPS